MPLARLCPKCGNILRGEELLDPVPAGRRLARELVLWLLVVVILTYLWGASTTGERIGGFGAIILVAWLLRRPRRRATTTVEHSSGRYHCDYCHGRFEGAGLREIDPPKDVERLH